MSAALVARLEAAPDEDITLRLSPPALLWDGHAIATLRPGASRLRPLVEVKDSPLLDGAQRERLRTRLQRFLDEFLRTALAPLFAATAARAAPALRGPLHRVAEGLGGAVEVPCLSHPAPQAS